METKHIILIIATAITAIFIFIASFIYYQANKFIPQKEEMPKTEEGVGVTKPEKEVTAFTNGHVKKKEKIKPLFECDRKKYLRYQTVYFRFKHPEKDTIISPTVTIFRERRVFYSGLAGSDKVKLHLSSEKGLFEGSWHMPINPPMGKYEAVLVYEESGKLHRMSAAFEIEGRTPVKVEKPIAFVLLESMNTLESREGQYMAPDGTKGGYTNLIASARFMGADAFAACVGATKLTSEELSKTNVWAKEKLSILDTLGAETKKQNMQFGAWIQAFFVQTPFHYQPTKYSKFRMKHMKRLGYTPSVKFDVEKKIFVPDWHCSLSDSKRIQDIAELAAKLDKDERVDYIGLDYIRTLATGGMELAEDFVIAMDLEAPAGFKSWTDSRKMEWLYEVRHPNDEGKYVDEWRYYKAQKAAKVIEKVIGDSKMEKPMWLFNLGWRHGIEHGQDPLMFLDAGTDFAFMMMYEIFADSSYDYNIDILWQSAGYGDGDKINLIPGNSTVARLMLSKNLNPIDEYVRRVNKSLHMFKNGMPKGVFYHDLWRANFMNNKGYPYIEWIVAGGKAFSDMRNAYNVLPISSEMEVERDKKEWVKLKVSVKVKNISPDVVTNIKVKIVPTPDLVSVDDEKVIKEIFPTVEKTLTFNVSFIYASHGRSEAMIPVLIKWSDTDHRERLFDYKYVNIK